MDDFIDSKASKEVKKLKKLKASAINSSEEEDEGISIVPSIISYHCSNACPSKPADDKEQFREELGDLIDDNPIEEESSSSESGDDEPGGTKRKRDDDDELDDRLSEDQVRVTTYF